MKRDQLLAEAKKLPPEERQSFAIELLDSLDGQDDLDDEAWTEAWRPELERRLRSMEDGTVKGIPWEEVRRRLLARLDGPRS
jgi:putative addiction module component (TIGR02574 family)